MAIEDWLLSRARVSNKEHAPVKMDDKLVFIQQLATLVSSGTPLLEAIQIAAQQNSSTRMRSVLMEVANRVSAGCALHEALSDYGHIFPNHWVEIMRIGEITGEMASVLCDLNDQVRESGETRRKVVGALIYPIILSLVGVLVLMIMLWFVVPQFEGMFTEMGADLPAITQYVVSASDFIVAYGVFIIVAVIVVAVALRQYLKTEKGRRRVGAIGLAVPVVGDLMVQSAMYSFSSNMGLLLRSGVPMLECLFALSTIFRSNPVYRDAITLAERRVAAGRPLAESLDETNLFTSMLTDMVRIGEESAQLALVMDQMAPYYKDKMQNFITKLTKMMEPAIIVVMGGAISVMMLAIYIPMFDMSGNVK